MEHDINLSVALVAAAGAVPAFILYSDLGVTLIIIAGINYLLHRSNSDWTVI